MELIVSLLSGAVGGNLAGALFKKISMGPLINSISGIVGGGLGGTLLGMLGVATGGGGMDIGQILGTVVSSGVGGGVLLAIVGFIKNAMAK